MSEGVSAWWKERRSSISDSMNLLPGNQPSYCPSMSYTTRLYGFAICLGLGILVAILSCIFIFFLNFVAFGVMYTVGNLLSIGSSLFLMGPIRQIKSMCAPVRLITTLVFFFFMGLTLFCAFYLKVGILFCALFWYTVSYIPFMQKCLCSCFMTTTGLDEAS